MMRKIALLLVVFFVACSSTPGIEKRTFEGGPGQPIEVELVGASQPMLMSPRDTDTPQQINFQFLVSNNSDEILTVKRIQVYQHGSAPIQLESGQGGFDTSIDPGHDSTFTVYATAKQLRPARQGDAPEITIRVDVALTNGDSYVYDFAVPIAVSGR
jgi:hypothetical protein